MGKYIFFPLSNRNSFVQMCGNAWDSRTEMSLLNIRLIKYIAFHFSPVWTAWDAAALASMGQSYIIWKKSKKQNKDTEIVIFLQYIA